MAKIATSYAIRKTKLSYFFLTVCFEKKAKVQAKVAVKQLENVVTLATF